MKFRHRPCPEYQPLRVSPFFFYIMSLLPFWTSTGERVELSGVPDSVGNWVMGQDLSTTRRELLDSVEALMSKKATSVSILSSDNNLASSSPLSKEGLEQELILLIDTLGRSRRWPKRHSSSIPSYSRCRRDVLAEYQALQRNLPFAMACREFGP